MQHREPYGLISCNDAVPDRKSILLWVENFRKTDPALRKFYLEYLEVQKIFLVMEAFINRL